MSFGEAQRQGKERAARERLERSRKLENFEYAATNGGGTQIGRQFTFDEVLHASLVTARSLGYVLVLRPGTNERTWLVRAVKE